MFSREAFKLCITAFPQVMQNPGDLEARGQMQLGAAYAGVAIENSMLGAAHAAANPLTAHFDIVHGQAVGIMLPHVIRFNSADQGSRAAYAELASAASLANAGDGLNDPLAALLARLEDVLHLAGLPLSLAECGVEKAAISMLADEAARQWTATFNPRSVSRADFVELYRGTFEARPTGSRLASKSEGNRILPPKKKGAVEQRPR